MCSCLQGDETSRHLCKRLLDRFRCRRYFLFQNDFARFIQNTVERPTISQIHTDGLLLLLHNFITECLQSANLLHRRSPFCASSASFIGSVSHPAGRPAFSSHLVSRVTGKVPGQYSTCPVCALIRTYTETLHLNIYQRRLKINWMKEAGANT